MSHQSRRVDQAVARAHTGGPRDDAVCHEQKRFRDEHQARWTAWAATAALPESTPQACAAPGAAMGLRLGQLVTLCARIFSHHRGPSRATVGRWVAQARQRAGGMCGGLARAGQVGVMRRGVEDICFGHDPVLGAVAPHRMAGLAGPRGPNRTGETWGAVRQAWPP